MSKPTVQIEVEIGRDDEMEAFGAYLSPSVRDGKALVRLNIGAMLAVHAAGHVPFKELFIETVMHEVGHALEEVVDLPFDEERIERLIATYRERYGQQSEAQETDPA